MADEQAMVEAFHSDFDIIVNSVPTVVDGRTRELRVRLIQEEFDELKEALAAEDLSVHREGDGRPPLCRLRHRGVLWHRYGAGFSGSTLGPT